MADQPDELTVGAVYTLSVSAPATYTVWLRGYVPNAAGDSVYVSLAGQVVTVTGQAPARWDWANLGLPGGDPARLTIRKPGVYTLGLWLREDGLLVDRLLLTTDTAFLPAGFGPAATLRQQSGTAWPIHLDRTIVYTYDSLYRLTGADYSTGESFAYEYDPVGNRLAQIIDGETTAYHYDAANRLAWVSAGGISQTYTFDANGNLLATGALTNSWDAANRLVEAARSEAAIQPLYNGLGHRVGQTTALTTTYFALDVVGLPEVIHTGGGDAYLHLPGVIVAENAGGEVRYLLSDGLGSIRQAVDEAGAVVAYNEYDPYGNPAQDGGDPYGFTGEWWQSEVGLLHLRARWYWPETGTFLSKDELSSIPAYLYASNNPINRVDPSGYVDWSSCQPTGQPDVMTCNLEPNDHFWNIGRDIINRNNNLPGYTGDANIYINRYMAPAMERLNPNLSNPTFCSSQYPSIADCEWRCPSCMGSTINLPTSWLQGLTKIFTPPPSMSVINPPSPMPPNNGCPSQNLLSTEPLRFELRYAGLLIPTELIVFPPNNPPIISAHRDQNFATILGVGSAVMDGIELFSSPFGIIPDAAALFDIVIAAGASYYSGESYLYQSPHPSLPPMMVVGQDVLVTSADAGIALTAKAVLPALGAAIGTGTGGLPGGVGGGLTGYLGGRMVDVATTTASFYYDVARVRGKAATYLSYAIFWEGELRQAILMYRQ